MPTRIQRKRTAGWTLAAATTNPLGAVIVSRPSRYGNRCKVATMQEMGYDDPHAAAAANYRAWLNGDRLNAPTDEADQQRDRILDSIPDLRGKDVACTCRADQTCHGDYLLHLAALPVDEYNAWASRVRARVDRNRVWCGDAPLHPIHHALAKAVA